MSKALNRKNKKIIKMKDSNKYKDKNPKYKSKGSLKRLVIKKVCFVSNSVIAEMIYLKEKNKGVFVVYYSQINKIKIRNKFKYKGKIYIPDSNSKLIQKNVVMIPNGIKEYGSTQSLIFNLHRLLDKYVYIKNAIDNEIIVVNPYS